MYYKRIFIKSNADLPKKMGHYACFCKEEGYTWYGFPQHTNEDWLSNVVWYQYPLDDKEVFNDIFDRMKDRKTDESIDMHKMVNSEDRPVE
jgi:hypothetical protein